MSNIKCMNCMSDFDDMLGDVCPHCGHSKFGVQSDANALQAGSTLKEAFLVGNVLSSNAAEIKYIGWDMFRACKVVIVEFFPKRLCTRRAGSAALNVLAPSSPMFNKAKFIFENRARAIRNQADVAGITHVLDVVQENNTAYVITEFKKGVTLERLVEARQFSWTDFKDVFTPLLQTVTTLHERGVRIGSISPESIIVSRNGDVTFSAFDFENEDKVSSSLSIHDVENSDCAAIELYRNGAALSTATDLYALAAVMYYTLTRNRVPLAHDRVKNDMLVPPSKFGIDIKPGAENALLNALAVEQNARTDDVKAFSKELFGKSKLTRLFASSGRRPSKKAIIAASCAGGVLLCAVIGVSIYFLLSSKPAPEDEATSYKLGSICGQTEEDAQKTIDAWEKDINELRKAQGIKKKFRLNLEVKTKYVSEKMVTDDQKIDDNSIDEQFPFENITVDIMNQNKCTIRAWCYKKGDDSNAIWDDSINYDAFPSVIGKTKEEAEAVLLQWAEKYGLINFNIDTVEQYSDSYSDGQVCDQSVKSGDEKITFGQIKEKLKNGITLYVSKGEKPSETTANQGAARTTTTTTTTTRTRTRTTPSTSTSTERPVVTQAPATQAPATQAPATQAPATQAPSTPQYYVEASGLD